VCDALGRPRPPAWQPRAGKIAGRPLIPCCDDADSFARAACLPALLFLWSPTAGHGQADRSMSPLAPRRPPQQAPSAAILLPPARNPDRRLAGFGSTIVPFRSQATFSFMTYSFAGAIRPFGSGLLNPSPPLASRKAAFTALNCGFSKREPSAFPLVVSKGGWPGLGRIPGKAARARPHKQKEKENV
jgi:hypothetical protein